MRTPFSILLRSRAWREHVLPPEILQSPRILPALQAIEERWPVERDEQHESDSPIFILSAGWGSGSTLLQRLVVSSGECMIWGEPFDHAATIHRLSQSICAINADWPRQQYFIDPAGREDFANTWIANLTPAFRYLRDAHGSFLRAWLQAPCAELGYRRWGMKEVRLTIDHARYLKWLFPGAKFLLIYRDVLDSYRSCKGVNWYSVWPDYRVRRVSLFAHHWRFLLEGFLEHAEALGAKLIKFEDFVSGGISTDEIARFLGTDGLDENVMKSKIGSRRNRHASINLAERLVLTDIAGELRRRLGYA